MGLFGFPSPWSLSAVLSDNTRVPPHDSRGRGNKMQAGDPLSREAIIIAVGPTPIKMEMYYTEGSGLISCVFILFYANQFPDPIVSRRVLEKAAFGADTRTLNGLS